MSGRLRNKVELLVRDSSVDAFGDRSESYATVGYRWGEVVDSSGREFGSDMGQESEVNTRITLRQDSLTKTLKNDDAIGYGGVTYLIESIKNKDNRKRFLELQCVKDDR
jgi:SPP1 family predicted phage head-tail adaptor